MKKMTKRKKRRVTVHGKGNCNVKYEILEVEIHEKKDERQINGRFKLKDYLWLIFKLIGLVVVFMKIV